MADDPDPSERYLYERERAAAQIVPRGGAGTARPANLAADGGRRFDAYDAPAMKAVTM